MTSLGLRSGSVLYLVCNTEMSLASPGLFPYLEKIRDDNKTYLTALL